MTTFLSPAVADRAETEIVLWRVATTAITWGIEPAAGDAADMLREAVAWCLHPLRPEAAAPLRIVVAQSILDPTRHRQVLVAALHALTPDDTLAGLRTDV